MASAAAQTEPAPPPPPIRVDTVVATVNDSAILLSSLQTNAVGPLRTLEARFGRVRPEDLRRVLDDELQKLIDRHTMAQAAKTFGTFTPEQVETLLKREFERDEQQQIRDFGSHQAWSQALQNQGRTWQTFVSEQRVDKLARYAEEFAVHMRLQRQSNLYLTPRMMRETYERENGRFVRPAEARVALVVFQGADAAANAAAAAESWRTQELTSRALAARFPGATAVDDANASAMVAAVSQWALSGPQGKVSDPIAAGSAWQVAKVLAYLPARNGRFEDPDVQEELRAICRKGVVEEFEKQALERARQRSEVWVAPWHR
ncbi:MAG: peptidyl-prolyl cis-trans isomerase [Planctomycetes bacterium]|nr:peptidyl-prolyl cis-trans isomerase [Planctomycetota bacterium]